MLNSLMPSAKCNSTMDVATGLISSLFDVSLSRDVPFHQPQDVPCMHHGLTFMFQFFLLTTLGVNSLQHNMASLRQCMRFLHQVYLSFFVLFFICNAV